MLDKSIYNAKGLDMTNSLIKRYLFQYCKRTIEKMQISGYSFRIYRLRCMILCNR